VDEIFASAAFCQQPPRHTAALLSETRAPLFSLLLFYIGLDVCSDVFMCLVADLWLVDVLAFALGG
jgi:hypothetical protein